MLNIEVYTDGSCKGNGYKNSKGGWGFVVLQDGVVAYDDCGGATDTTNNRMELTALHHGCAFINKFYKKRDFFCTVYTDSAYIHNCITQKWWVNWEKNNWKNAKKQPVKNKDLWELIIPFFKNSNFTFEKVKGHNGVKYNEEADRLACLAAENVEEINKLKGDESIYYESNSN